MIVAKWLKFDAHVSPPWPPFNSPSMSQCLPYVTANKTLIKLIIGWSRNAIGNLALALPLLSVFPFFFFFLLLVMFVGEEEKKARENLLDTRTFSANWMRGRKPMGCFSHFISSSLILKKSFHTASFSH